MSVSKLVRNPYAIAIALHVVAFAVLSFFVFDHNSGRTAETLQQSVGADGHEQPESQSPSVSAEELQNRVAASQFSAEKLTVGEKTRAAQRFARKLEEISSPKAMQEIGAFLGGQLGWKKRTPKNDDPKEFDHATALPVRVIEKPKSGGGVQLYFVMEDARKNTVEVAVPPGEETAARTLQLLDRSSVLRELRNSVLFPFIDSKLDDRPPPKS